MTPNQIEKKMVGEFFDAVGVVLFLAFAAVVILCIIPGGN